MQEKLENNFWLVKKFLNWNSEFVVGLGEQQIFILFLLTHWIQQPIPKLRVLNFYKLLDQWDCLKLMSFPLDRRKIKLLMTNNLILTFFVDIF